MLLHPPPCSGLRVCPQDAENVGDEFLTAARDYGHAARIDPDAKQGILEITVEDFLKLSDTERSKWHMYTADSLAFGHDDDDEEYVNQYIEKLEVDPYFLGLWLGDGTERRAEITNNHESEIVEYLRRYAALLDMNLREPKIRDNKDLSYAFASKPAKQKELERRQDEKLERAEEMLRARMDKVRRSKSSDVSFIFQRLSATRKLKLTLPSSLRDSSAALRPPRSVELLRPSAPDLTTPMWMRKDASSGRMTSVGSRSSRPRPVRSQSPPTRSPIAPSPTAT